MPRLDTWVAGLFDEENLDDTCEKLAAADPKVKAEVYAEMGIDLAYHPDGRVVVESQPRLLGLSVGEASVNPSRRVSALSAELPAKPSSATPVRLLRHWDQSELIAKTGM